MHGWFVAELVGDAKLSDGSAAIQLDRYVKHSGKAHPIDREEPDVCKSKRHTARRLRTSYRRRPARSAANQIRLTEKSSCTS